MSLPLRMVFIPTRYIEILLERKMHRTLPLLLKKITGEFYVRMEH
jgi:hypothetical protein